MRYSPGDPLGEPNDIFILSKGHAAPLLGSCPKSVITLEALSIQQVGQGRPVDVASSSLPRQEFERPGQAHPPLARLGTHGKGELSSGLPAQG